MGISTRTIVWILVALFVIATGVAAWQSLSAASYRRSHAVLEKDTAAWQQERAKLLADAELKERQIAELETKNQAFQAAADAGKKLDADKAQQIAELAKKESEDEANANVPVDCRVRAQRICDMFRASDPKFDCRTLFKQCAQ